MPCPLTHLLIFILFESIGSIMQNYFINSFLINYIYIYIYIYTHSYVIRFCFVLQKKVLLSLMRLNSINMYQNSETCLFQIERPKTPIWPSFFRHFVYRLMIYFSFHEIYVLGLVHLQILSVSNTWVVFDTWVVII